MTWAMEDRVKEKDATFYATWTLMSVCSSWENATQTQTHLWVSKKPIAGALEWPKRGGEGCGSLKGVGGGKTSFVPQIQ